MTMSANLHSPTRVVAMKSQGTEWLHAEDGKGNDVVIFMPYAAAKAMADAYAAAMTPAPEVEGVAV